MPIDYRALAIPKPEPRTRTKARQRRTHRQHVAEVRAAVFAREAGLCRICGRRRAESLHEILPRSLGGKVSRENSIAVCGDGVRGCHGLAQRHEIHITGNAQQELHISAATARARGWLEDA